MNTDPNEATVAARAPTPTPTPTPSAPPTATSTPTPTVPQTPTLPAPLGPAAPRPATALTAALQECDVEEVEAAVVGVREAWRRGDQSVIAEALISQAALLEALGVKLLGNASTVKDRQAVQLYGNLALRALEQARKALATLSGLSATPGRSAKPGIQTNVQVNVGGRPNEKFVDQDGERLDR